MTTAPSSIDTPVEDAAIDTSVAESSSYELLKKRLEAQGDQLLAKAQALNAARIEQFGQRDQQLLMRLRARTEHNCVARDLAYIGGNRLLFMPSRFFTPPCHRARCAAVPSCSTAFPGS